MEEWGGKGKTGKCVGRDREFCVVRDCFRKSYGQGRGLTSLKTSADVSSEGSLNPGPIITGLVFKDNNNTMAYVQCKYEINLDSEKSGILLKAKSNLNRARLAPVNKRQLDTDLMNQNSSS